MELPRRLSREERGQDDARRDSGDRGRHNTAYWLQREQCIFPGRQFDSLRLLTQSKGAVSCSETLGLSWSGLGFAILETML